MLEIPNSLHRPYVNHHDILAVYACDESDLLLRVYTQTVGISAPTRQCQTLGNAISDRINRDELSRRPWRIWRVLLQRLHDNKDAMRTGIVPGVPYIITPLVSTQLCQIYLFNDLIGLCVNHALVLSIRTGDEELLIDRVVCQTIWVFAGRWGIIFVAFAIWGN